MQRWAYTPRGSHLTAAQAERGSSPLPAMGCLLEERCWLSEGLHNVAGRPLQRDAFGCTGTWVRDCACLYKRKRLSSQTSVAGCGFHTRHPLLPAEEISPALPKVTIWVLKSQTQLSILLTTWPLQRRQSAQAPAACGNAPSQRTFPKSVLRISTV